MSLREQGGETMPVSCSHGKEPSTRPAPPIGYCLTVAGRKAFRRSRKTWHNLTGGRLDSAA
jgi:hypothetical protein